MNSSVFDATMSMIMTMNKKISYDYVSFWNAFSFSQVPTEDWDDFAFFQPEIPSRSRFEVTAPLPLQFASKESGFFLAEDAIFAGQSRVAKEVARNFQAKLDERMREIAIQKDREYEEKEAKFREARDAKLKAQQAEEAKTKKNFVYKMFSNKKTRQEEIDRVVLATRQSEARKAKKNEKKVLDQSREEFFLNPSLIDDEEWLVAIGKNLGMQYPSRMLREIREKLNVSKETVKSTVEEEKKVDEITEVEISTLTEEQVAVLAEAQKADEEEILILTSTFVVKFELAEIQREKESKETEAMSSVDKESKLFNQISRAVETRIVNEEDDGFVLVKSKKKRNIQGQEEVKEEVTLPKKIILGASSYAKKKINRICRALKVGSNGPCSNFSCQFLHDLDELEISSCNYKSCCRVKEVSSNGDLISYVNVDGGCKFIHKGETRDAFFIREGFLPEVKSFVEEEKKTEAKEEEEFEEFEIEEKASVNSWGDVEETTRKIKVLRRKVVVEETKVEVQPEVKVVIPGSAVAPEKRKNRICRNMKADSTEPCTNESCVFLHNFDELKVDNCQFNKCNRVKEIAREGDLISYINLGGGCKFIHKGETRNAYFVREGFNVVEPKVEESKGEVYQPAIIDCNAWKEKNSKIYSYPEQKHDAHECKHEGKHHHHSHEVKVEENVDYSNTKTKLCESVSSGNHCRHGSKCRFAHSVDEINIPECPHGSRCGFVQIRKGVFSNSEGKFCRCIHPDETRENYFSRNGMVVKVVEKKPECSKLKTKICNSILKGVKCERKHCDFAHNEKELNIRECTFPNCKLVDINRYGVLVNVDPSNRCSFFHKGETKSSFFQRLTY